MSTIKQSYVTCPRCGRKIPVAEYEFVTLCECFTFIFIKEKEDTPAIQEDIASAS